MTDLFDWRPYPVTAGFKRHGTSEAATQSMNRRAPTLRERIMALFADGQQFGKHLPALLHRSGHGHPGDGDIRGQHHDGGAHNLRGLPFRLIYVADHMESGECGEHG